MKVEALSIKGVFFVRAPIHGDKRGYFMETYSAAKWREAGLEPVQFVQDNLSKSEKVGTLRGLHYQVGANPQAKLIRVIVGAIKDVVVDLRTSSPTFGQHLIVDLMGETGDQLYIPAGFAHGFITTEPGTIIAYKVSAPYDPTGERGIAWNDAALAIKWGMPADQITLSERDQHWPSLSKAEHFT